MFSWNNHKLTLFNSLSRKAEVFQSIHDGEARVYTCGPTVYNHQHIGNMRAYIFADTLGRTLRWKGYRLTHIINITDVGHLTSDADVGEDKMEKAAAARQMSIWDIASHYTALFKTDVSRLNICEPARWAVATDHIDEMIDFANKIADKHAYQLDSGLYFDTSTVPEYGKLAGAAADAGVTRIDPVDGKRQQSDFALWRSSAPGENRQMEWDSPWGRGAPGWHLECSVMSMKYLGERFDIHTGGIDHREIHHPNEIAQNQAFNACEHSGANIWMHNNFLIDRGGKMSKSSGEFLRLQLLIDRGFHPLAYRMMCLQAHYRSELEYSWSNLHAALTRLKRIVGTIQDIRQDNAVQELHMSLMLAMDNGKCDNGKGQLPIVIYKDLAARVEHPRLIEQLEKFDAAISDDLNTAKALTVMEDTLRLKRLDMVQKYAALILMDGVLGLNLIGLSRQDLRIAPADADISEVIIESMLERRNAARKDKDFAASDAIRDELAAKGIEVMDGDALGWDWILSAEE